MKPLTEPWDVPRRRALTQINACCRLHQQFFFEQEPMMSPNLHLHELTPTEVHRRTA